MAGMSDSGQPDDTKLHLETIVGADDAQKTVPAEETEDQRIHRESALLSARLRAKVDAALAELRTEVPGLSAAETAKLLATRAGRDALDKGVIALARVDDHLQSVTEERNPIVGKKYGVYGANPTSFGGVMRSLELSSTENARLGALAADATERELLFTPLIAREVEQARDALARILGARVSTRAELSRAVAVKDEVLDRARTVISAVRQHLYANLPNRKQDPDLRRYGFVPVSTGGRPPADPVVPVGPVEPPPAG